MITAINNLSKMGKVRFYVVAGLACLLAMAGVGLAVQFNTISQLKADVKQAKIQAKTINIPADGKSHTIHTNLFDIEVKNYDDANFDGVITPRIGRVIGDQCDGYDRSLDIISVSSSNTSWTTPQ